MSVYTATKAAVSQFAHSLRCDVSPRFGIWCCTMEIGAFKTKLTTDYHGQYNTLVNTLENRKEMELCYNFELEQTIFDSRLTVVHFDENLSVLDNDLIHALTAK